MKIKCHKIVRIYTLYIDIGLSSSEDCENVHENKKRENKNEHKKKLAHSIFKKQLLTHCCLELVITRVGPMVLLTLT